MPTSISNLSTYDAEGATEEGGNAGGEVGIGSIESSASPHECKVRIVGADTLCYMCRCPSFPRWHVCGVSFLGGSSAIMSFLSEGR